MYGQAPRILPPLQSQTLVENNRLMFETKITGEPTPEVVWYKDDAPIQPGPNIQVRMARLRTVSSLRSQRFCRF